MMRKLQLWVSAMVLVSAVALSPLFVGCEDEPNDFNADSLLQDSENQDRDDGIVELSIEPVLASISYVGERIALRAKGAIEPVIWSPANYDAGKVTIVGPRSDYAVFQSKMLLPNSVLAKDAAGRTATMDIMVGSIGGLRLIPSDVTIYATNGAATVQFVVSGGAPPYSSWDVAFTSLGDVSQSGLYTSISDAIGTNIVTVVDAAGDIATATVQQIQ